MPLRAMASLRMRRALIISHPTHAWSADSLSAPVVRLQGEREPMRSKTEGLIEIFKQAERTGAGAGVARRRRRTSPSPCTRTNPLA